MPSVRRRVAVLAVLAILGGFIGPVRADDDHERARAALQAGDIRPLSEILAAVARDFGGDVLEIELEGEHGTWIYEVKLLSAGGAVLRLAYDASTGTLLRSRGDDGGRRRR